MIALGSKFGLFRMIGFAGIAAVIVLMLSCNIITPIAQIVKPGRKRPAAYTLNDVPTVVFVDDRGSILSSTALRRVIGDTVSEQLMVQKLITTTIDPADAIALSRRGETNSNPMPLDVLGEKLGAQQVIYVEVMSYNLGPNAFTPSPSAVCRVRVIDVVNHKRLFPADLEGQLQKGQMVSAGGEMISPDLIRTESMRRLVEEQICREVADNITKLFYKHKIRQPGENLKPR